MAEYEAFDLPPVKVEIGRSPDGGAVQRRLVRTDEGIGAETRCFIYSEQPGDLELLATGATREEAMARAGALGVGWAPAGEEMRARVADRRKRFLDAFISTLFEDRPQPLTVDRIRENAEQWIAQLPTATRRELNMAIWLLEKLLGGNFPNLSLDERKRRIPDRLDDLWGLFKDLGRIRTVFYASYFQDSAAWPSIGFVHPEQRARKWPGYSKYDELLMSPLAETESCDWLVIGSGCGGAAAAAALAARGRKVLVIDRGGYFPVKDMSHRDTEQYARIYVAGGLQTTANRNIAVLQANAIGGSSLINNCICFRPGEPGWTHPDADDVIGRWVSKLRLNIDRDKLAAAFTHLETALQVQTITEDLIGANGRHLLTAWTRWLDSGLAAAADRAAPCRPFKKNYGTGDRRCWGCGYCNSGCPYYRKNSVAQTLLVSAQSNEARLANNVEALRIVYRDPDAQPRRADYVEVRQRGKRRIIRVRDGVIVAAGVGASTMLLRQSGIESGAKVTCNLACPVIARMPHQMDSWDGLQMATYVDRGSHLIESWFHPPATFCATMGGWFGEYLGRMAQYSRLACMAALMPTTKGWVGIDGRINITLEDGERALLRGYVEDVVRIHFAGGADEVYLPTPEGRAVRRDELGGLTQTIRETFRKTEDFILSTAHPQGGNPMGRNAQLGTVGANLRVHGCRNLYVADASIFPSSIRVNPQMTVMAFAHAAFAG